MGARQFRTGADTNGSNAHDVLTKCSRNQAKSRGVCESIYHCPPIIPPLVFQPLSPRQVQTAKPKAGYKPGARTLYWLTYRLRVAFNLNGAPLEYRDTKHKDVRSNYGSFPSPEDINWLSG